MARPGSAKLTPTTKRLPTAGLGGRRQSDDKQDIKETPCQIPPAAAQCVTGACGPRVGSCWAPQRPLRPRWPFRGTAATTAPSEDRRNRGVRRNPRPDMAAARRGPAPRRDHRPTRHPPAHRFPRSVWARIARRPTTRATGPHRRRRHAARALRTGAPTDRTGGPQRESRSPGVARGAAGRSASDGARPRRQHAPRPCRAPRATPSHESGPSARTVEAEIAQGLVPDQQGASKVT